MDARVPRTTLRIGSSTAGIRRRARTASFVPIAIDRSGIKLSILSQRPITGVCGPPLGLATRRGVFPPAPVERVDEPSELFGRCPRRALTADQHPAVAFHGDVLQVMANWRYASVNHSCPGRATASRSNPIECSRGEKPARGADVSAGRPPQVFLADEVPSHGSRTGADVDQMMQPHASCPRPCSTDHDRCPGPLSFCRSRPRQSISSQGAIRSRARRGT